MPCYWQDFFYLCRVLNHNWISSNSSFHNKPFVPKSRLQIYDLTTSVLCSPSEVPEGGFPNRIPMVMRGNCTFYEKVRLAQINGAKGLLIVSKDRLVSLFGTINACCVKLVAITSSYALIVLSADSGIKINLIPNTKTSTFLKSWWFKEATLKMEQNIH